MTASEVLCVLAVKRCKFCEQDHEVETMTVLGVMFETCDVLPEGAVYYDVDAGKAQR